MSVKNGLFTIIGFVIIFFGAKELIEANKFVDNALYVQGKVIGLEKRSSDDGWTYSPVVEFELHEEGYYQFVSSFSSNPASHDIGELVTVIYSPENHSDAKINSFMGVWFESTIFLSLGLIFTLIGIVPTIMNVFYNKNKGELLEKGKKLSLNISEIKEASYEVNGRTPFTIIVKWKDPKTSEKYVFKSKKIWYNPKVYIEENSVDVYINPDNPKKYFIDISFLPKHK